MSLSKSPENISSAAIQRLTTSLAEFKNTVVGNAEVMDNLAGLKRTITALEDVRLAQQSKATADTLSRMGDEERRLLLMWPEEKAFFLRYKAEHPDDPWSYYEEYRKTISEAYEQTGELPSL